MKQHRRFCPHVISPVLGMVVIGYVCLNMNIHALTLRVIWSVIGLAWFLWYRKAHKQDIHIDLEKRKLLD